MASDHLLDDGLFALCGRLLHGGVVQILLRELLRMMPAQQLLRASDFSLSTGVHGDTGAALADPVGEGVDTVLGRLTVKKCSEVLAKPLRPSLGRNHACMPGLACRGQLDAVRRETIVDQLSACGFGRRVLLVQGHQDCRHNALLSWKRSKEPDSSGGLAHPAPGVIMLGVTESAAMLGEPRPRCDAASHCVTVQLGEEFKKNRDAPG